MNSSAIELSLLAHRLNALCEQMGAVLRRTAISPNIKDRLDFSCALFDAEGELVAQAAHIPVHLGSMGYAMRQVVDRFGWQDGDVVLFNDPQLGGTHLPDMTLVMPALREGKLLGFAAARAHHADIGGETPGSMGVHESLAQEGLLLAPQYWYRAGELLPGIEAQFRQQVRAVEERLGDLAAQRASALCGVAGLIELAGQGELAVRLHELQQRSEQYGRTAIATIPDGSYCFADYLEEDGFGHGPLPIKVAIRIEGESATVDFNGSSGPARGPLNAPQSVTAAAVHYAFRCLMPFDAPQSAAIFRPIRLIVPPNSLLAAPPSAPVAAGNVETSQRIVDVVLGALAQALPDRIPAAAQGTMNNVLFGALPGGESEWVYYETVGGGMGAHAQGEGLSAVQCHMTNSRNSSIELLEAHYPLRIRRYAIRRGSGGKGRHPGGDGMLREWELLQPAIFSLLAERRQSRPYGLNGGESGKAGVDRLWRDRRWQPLPAKGSCILAAGERVCIETPGGGGFGSKENE